MNRYIELCSWEPSKYCRFYSSLLLQAWLSDHQGKFGHFINNEFVIPGEGKFVDSIDPSTGSVLAQTFQGTAEDVDTAVKSAAEAYTSWSALSGHERAKHIYRCVFLYKYVMAIKLYYINFLFIWILATLDSETFIFSSPLILFVVCHIPGSRQSSYSCYFL